MNPQQGTKLKGLIQSSAILSPSEKTEWLTLLEIMDDKQLGELEKILTQSSSPKPEVKPAWRPDALPVLKVKPPKNQLEIEAHPKTAALPAGITKPAPIKEPAGQMPKLSHIVNLPKNLDHTEPHKPSVLPPLKNKPTVAYNAKQPTLAEVAEQKKNQLPPVKKESGFLKRLKLILSEKELPAGLPAKPSAAPKIIPPTIDHKTSITPEIVKPQIKVEPPKVPQPKAPVVEIPKTVKPPVEAIKPKPIIEPKVEPKPKAEPNFGFKLKEQVEPLIKPKVETGSPKPKAPTGVDFSHANQKAQDEILAEVKEHIRDREAIEQVVKPEVPIAKEEAPANLAKDINLEKLDDLSGLTVSMLNNTDFLVLVSKIKKLINREGYHEAIFNIEKSPLYQAYIKTGSQVLDGKISFEGAADKNQSQYLNRKSFEGFADLLRKIQAE